MTRGSEPNNEGEVGIVSGEGEGESVVCFNKSKKYRETLKVNTDSITKEMKH